MRAPLLPLTLALTVLTLVVIVLGAYTRLADAGLGCPDWPGCYGRLGVPVSDSAIAAANAAFPERPVEVPKAWAEMIHRYFAGALGLFILAQALLAWRNRDAPGQPVVLPMLLVALVAFQAILGMWTVTLMLKPVVVMAHLLGGFATLSLLWWLALRQGLLPRRTAGTVSPALRIGAVLVLTVLVLQIALGGWTSANYAALACTDFPTCHGSWWPETDFREAFTLWRGTGVNYEFGVLDSAARVSIHLVHRLGALATLLLVGWLGIWLVARRDALELRLIGALMLTLLVLQVALGIANVILSLPLPVAVAHNAVAALLLLTLVTLNQRLHNSPR
jgi:heme a synthase